MILNFIYCLIILLLCFELPIIRPTMNLIMPTSPTMDTLALEFHIVVSFFVMLAVNQGPQTIIAITSTIHCLMFKRFAFVASSLAGPCKQGCFFFIIAIWVILIDSSSSLDSHTSQRSFPTLHLWSMGSERIPAYLPNSQSGHDACFLDCSLCASSGIKYLQPIPSSSV